MGIKTSAFAIEQYRDDVMNMSSALCDASNAIINASNELENSIKEMVDSLKELIFKMDKDFEEVRYVVNHNKEAFDKLNKDLGYYAEQMKKSQDAGYIAKCKDEIKDCKERMEQIKKKNIRLHQVTQEMIIKRKEIVPIYDQIVALAGQSSNSANRINRLYNDFVKRGEHYQNIANKAMHLVNEIDKHLSRASDSIPSDTKVISISSPQYLFDTAQSLRMGKEKIEMTNMDLNSYVSNYLNVIQDDISKTSTELCLRSARELENIVEEFNETANEFEEAGKCLNQYQNLK